MKQESFKDVYSQNADTCDGESLCEHQFLTIESHDGGAGGYLVIRTERWAMDESDLPAFVKLLKEHFRKIKEMDNAEL